MLALLLDHTIPEITVMLPLKLEDSSKNCLDHRCLPIPDTRTGHLGSWNPQDTGVALGP
jgi:hypothetical protein